MNDTIATQKEIISYTDQIRILIKEDTNFAVINLLNSKGKLSLPEIDENLKKPEHIGNSLKQLIEFGLLSESFERRSPIEAYFELDKLGKIVLDTLGINKKGSEKYVADYLSGKLKGELQNIIP